MKNCEWFGPKEYREGNNHEWSLETGWFSSMLNKKIQKVSQKLRVVKVLG